MYTRIQKFSISFSFNKSLNFCENHSWFLKSNHKLVFIENKIENVPCLSNLEEWNEKESGIQLSLTPHPNTRGAYFESFVSDQLFSVLLVGYN